MSEVIERHKLHLDKPDRPSLGFQPDNSSCIMLSSEIADRTRELRQMRGEDLEGLSLTELVKLENSLHVAMRRINQTKGDRDKDVIDCLNRKAAEIMEENMKLKHIMDMSMSQIQATERRQSSESMVTNVCNSTAPSQQYDNSNVFLTLRLSSEG